MRVSHESKKILLIWNGMTSKQVSGGDIYVKQLIEHSKYFFDIIQSKQSSNLVKSKNMHTIFCTGDEEPKSNFSIVTTYIKRAFRSSIFLSKSKLLNSEYAFLLSASPFICDLLPAIKKKNSHRVVILFHLIPARVATSPSMRIRFALAAFEQRFSLFLIGKYFDTILVGNENVRSELKKIMPNKQIIIAHAGIDTTAFQIENNQKDPNLGLFIGRLTSQKGVLDLVDIVSSILKKKPDFRLEIIGDGPHRHLLENKIKTKKIHAITILGFVSDAEKYRKLSNASFFLFPSYEEGWGIALAEGLYAGCVCVCYELDHYRSLFKGYPRYVKIGDISAFSESILKLYDSSPSLSQKDFIERYDYDTVVNDVFSNIFEVRGKRIH